MKKHPLENKGRWWSFLPSRIIHMWGRSNFSRLHSRIDSANWWKTSMWYPRNGWRFYTIRPDRHVGMAKLWNQRFSLQSCPQSHGRSNCAGNSMFSIRDESLATIHLGNLIERETPRIRGRIVELSLRKIFSETFDIHTLQISEKGRRSVTLSS